MHCSLVPQRRPQAPQFSSSVASALQAPLHDVWPDGHIATQAPALHAWPVGQTRPQPPQLFGSEASVTQRLLQRLVPAAVQRHWLLRHWPPTPQALPQAPQLFGSFWVKVQVPLQVTWPGKHAAWQLKPVHTWPPWQVTPQAPQLLGSVRDTQLLPQRRVGATHWQVPFVHVPFVPHELPHAPQFAGFVAVLVHRPLQST